MSLIFSLVVDSSITGSRILCFVPSKGRMEEDDDEEEEEEEGVAVGDVRDINNATADGGERRLVDIIPRFEFAFAVD